MNKFLKCYSPIKLSKWRKYHINLLSILYFELEFVELDKILELSTKY